MNSQAFSSQLANNRPFTEEERRQLNVCLTLSCPDLCHPRTDTGVSMLPLATLPGDRPIFSQIITTKLFRLGHVAYHLAHAAIWRIISQETQHQWLNLPTRPGSCKHHHSLRTHCTHTLRKGHRRRQSAPLGQTGDHLPAAGKPV